MQIVIDIPEEVYKNIMNDHGVSPYGMIFNSIQNGTPIPDNATNGDVLEIMFSKVNFYVGNWWDEPYQKGGKDE